MLLQYIFLVNYENFHFPNPTHICYTILVNCSALITG